MDAAMMNHKSSLRPLGPHTLKRWTYDLLEVVLGSQKLRCCSFDFFLRFLLLKWWFGILGILMFFFSTFILEDGENTVSLTTLTLRFCGCATCLRDLASNVATMLKRSGNRIRFRQFCLSLRVVKWLVYLRCTTTVEVSKWSLSVQHCVIPLFINHLDQRHLHCVFNWASWLLNICTFPYFHVMSQLKRQYCEDQNGWLAVFDRESCLQNSIACICVHVAFDFLWCASTRCWIWYCIGDEVFLAWRMPVLSMYIYLHIHTLMCVTNVVPSSVSCVAQISTVPTCSNINIYTGLCVWTCTYMDQYAHVCI